MSRLVSFVNSGSSSSIAQNTLPAAERARSPLHSPFVTRWKSLITSSSPSYLRKWRGRRRRRRRRLLLILNMRKRERGEENEKVACKAQEMTMCDDECQYHGWLSLPPHTHTNRFRLTNLIVAAYMLNRAHQAIWRTQLLPGEFELLTRRERQPSHRLGFLRRANERFMVIFSQLPLTAKVNRINQKTGKKQQPPAIIALWGRYQTVHWRENGRFSSFTRERE